MALESSASVTVEEENTLIKLNIKELSGVQYSVEINRDSTVIELKECIYSLKDIHPSMQRLIFNGQELVNNRRLNDYNIQDGRIIHLVKRRINPQPEAGHGIGADDAFDENTPLASAPDGTYQQQQYQQYHQQQQQHHQYQQQQQQYQQQQQQQYQYHQQQQQQQQQQMGDDVDIMEISRHTKLIRLFAVIDSILLILFAIFGAWIFLVVLPLALCGYFGAKNLNRSALVGYMLFIILSILFRLLLAYLYPTILMIILTVISVLLEFYILKITFEVFQSIPRLSPVSRRVLVEMSDMWF